MTAQGVSPRESSNENRGPRVFSISQLTPRANSPTSRSARIINPDTVGPTQFFSGVFWSEPGSTGGWSFGDSDPQIEGAPFVGRGEEIYVCLKGRLAVEWDGGNFEFGAGDVVYWPDCQWYRTKVIGDETVEIVYVMTPPPASIWSLGKPVTQTGASQD